MAQSTYQRLKADIIKAESALDCNIVAQELYDPVTCKPNKNLTKEQFDELLTMLSDKENDV